MKQISFAQAEHQNKKKVTRRERFLAQMESLVPWQRLIDALSPSYFPNAAGKRGRPPIGLERMLRIYFLQQWYALADEALEDAIYDSQAMRDFVGIDLAIESVPDATTLLRFRHLLEKHALTQRIFEEINAHLAEKGLFMREGTIVDATIVAAAPSTKNKAKQRDPEMKQTRKGNQWYFGMKAHIGVDAVTGLTHTVVATSANVADVTMADHLVRDDDKRVHADAGYIGMGKRLGEEKDAEDSLLWKFGRRRLEAEEIRDAMLAVSGALNRKAYGPAVYLPLPEAVIEAHTDKHSAWKPSPSEEVNRRTIYAFVKRTLMPPMLETFDFCDTTQSTDRRAITSVSTMRSGSSGSYCWRCNSAFRKPRSKLALCATSFASPMNSRNSSTTSANFGLSLRKSVDRPCTRNAASGISRSGFK